MGLVLIVDASIFGVSLGLKRNASDSDLLWRGSILERNGSAKMLSHLMNQGLNETKQNVKDINCIVVSNGPGTFTGIKVGIAWAQGLLAGLKEARISSYSGIKAAVSFLVKERSLNVFSVLLPITKSHGFLIQKAADDEEKSIALIQIEDESGRHHILKCLQGPIHIINKWDQMSEFLISNQLKVDFFDWEEVMRGSIEGVHEQIMEWPASKFSNKFIEPNYMRKSTAEERLALKKES